MKISRYLTSFLVLAAMLGCSISSPDPEPKSLEILHAQFVRPPNSSRPRTWFHVMSGNMTEAGITEDLESIKSVGIGGVLLFNVTQGILIGPIKFNSDEHIALIRHMAAEAERLGLAFGVHNCDGWTSSGGPWISASNSMKKVVWSETLSDGGLIDIELAQPDTLENYYQDIATIAYPRLPGETETFENQPNVSASQADLDIELITDGSVIGTTRLDASQDAPGYIDFEYAEPFTLRAINFRFMNARLAYTLLLSSDDGVDYTPVQYLTLRRPAKNDWGHDEALEKPVTARYFRLQSTVPLDVQEVKLSAVATLGNFWGRTGSAKTPQGDLPPIGAAPDASIIESHRVIDLTHKLSSDGRLTAELPEGEWTILRFGQTSTGARNLPASEEGIGLEVDKFSRSAVKVHYDAYMSNVVKAVKDVAPNAHQYTEIDSYEVGAQNWTNGYEVLFENKAGYSLIPFLPLYAGRFVDSPDVSERVTWDMRNVSNALMRDNYYGYFTELANQDGLQVYIEPYGDGPFNEIDAGGQADIPMGEFWVNRFGNRVNVAVSSAVIYGKNVVSAEAFTDIWDTNWKLHPAFVKTLGDMNWALGVNEFMFHRFAHQANTHVKPGMTMNRWGSHFDRTQTWWKSAGKAWIDYLSRGQHLLRQGVPIHDGLLFVGDGAPSECPDKEDTDLFPKYINFLCVNADVLQTRLIAEDGMFKLPEGQAYKFLRLSNSETMTRESLDALDRLTRGDGGLIVGHLPQNLAGFAHTEKARTAFSQTVHDIWARDTVITVDELEKQGWSSVYARVNDRPDLVIEGHPDAYYTHRQIGPHDVYFIYNSETKAQTYKAAFRVRGKKVSLWDARDGAIRDIKSFQAEQDHTLVDIDLAPQQSVFIVFDGQQPVSETVIATVPQTLSVQTIDSPWTISFDPDYGTGAVLEAVQLFDWSEHSDFDIQHYSGPVRYETRFDVSEDFLRRGELITLGLGDVQIAATVTLNGIDIGTSWVAPHQLDISDAIRAGDNTLSVRVENLWVNRLIGDSGLPDLDDFTPAAWEPKTQMPEWYSNNEPPALGERVTFTTQDFYAPTDPLLPSGLLGPVSVTVSKN